MFSSKSSSRYWQLSQSFSRLTTTEPSFCWMNDKTSLYLNPIRWRISKGDCNPSFFTENSVYFKHYSSSLSASSALHSSQIQSQQHSLQSSSHLSIRIAPSIAEICTAQSDVIPDTISASSGMLT